VEECGWCQETSKCAPISVRAGCPQSIGCTLNENPKFSTKEDAGFVLNINPLFLVPTETITSGEAPTSNYFSILLFSNPPQCNATFDQGSNNVTVTSTPNWFGTCQIKITATALVPTNGHKTFLGSIVDLTVTPVNDPPMKNEDTFESAVVPLSTFKQGGSVRVDGCGMFYDNDKQDFKVTLSGSPIGSVINVTTSTPCTCYTNSQTCWLDLKASAPFQGELTFTATDSSGESVAVNVGINVASVNQPPTATPGNVTINTQEGSAELRPSFSDQFVDPEGDQLSYNVSSQLLSLASFVQFEGSTLVIRLDPSKNGSATALVTASDGQYTASKYVTLNVSPVNDPIMIADSIKDKKFSQNAGTNSSFDLSTVVFDEDSSFAEGTLRCSASSITGGEAIITITKNVMTIQYKHETTGISSLINCDDSNGSFETFNINVVVTFINFPPTIKAPFPRLTSLPPTSGSQNVTSLKYSDYFMDSNVGQTLTYIIVASNATSVNYLLDSETGFTVQMFPGAMGGYTLNVTATDEKSASVSQTLNVWAYIPPRCSQILVQWNPVNQLTIDVATYCLASNSFVITFTENLDLETLFESVYFSINGTKITFTANDSCAEGKYLGVVTVTDTMNTSTPISVQLSTNNTAATVFTLKNTFTYLVTNSTDVNTTGYDGTAQVSGAKVKINLVQLVKRCGTDGPLDFFKIGSDYCHFLSGSTAGNQRIVGDLNGVELFLQGTSNGASILRPWEFMSSVVVQDRQTGDMANFTLSVIKPYEGV